MITYLLPLLIGYTGGRVVHGQRGAVVGATATMGIIVGTGIPMMLGAIKESIAILTLKNPIHFGNSDNNPVKYIFFLSALDNERHIDAMGELLELMNNSMFLNLLDQSHNSTDFMRYIDNFLSSNK